MANAKKAKPGNSGAGDPEKIKHFVERVENVQAAIEAEQSDSRETIKDMRDDIVHLIDEAERAGVSKKALKAVLKERQLLKKHTLQLTKLVAPLDIVERSNVDAVRHALGMLADTPLGAAAAKSNGLREVSAVAA